MRSKSQDMEKYSLAIMDAYNEAIAEELGKDLTPSKLPSRTMSRSYRIERAMPSKPVDEEKNNRDAGEYEVVDEDLLQDIEPFPVPTKKKRKKNNKKEVK